MAEITSEMIGAGYDAICSFPEMRVVRPSLVSAIAWAAYEAMRAIEPIAGNEIQDSVDHRLYSLQFGDIA